MIDEKAILNFTVSKGKMSDHIFLIKIKYLFIVLSTVYYLNINAYSFAWISDTHIEIGKKGVVDQGRRYSLSTTLLENTVRSINDSSVDFVVITGDILNDGRSWNLDAAKFILDKLNKPYYVVIGNNDFAIPETGLGISKTTFNTAFSITQPNYADNVWFCNPVKNLLLIGIDNINPISGGEAWTTKLLAKLENILETNVSDEIVLLLHYPIVELDYYKNGRLLFSAENFFEICKKNGVNLICSGHYHYREFQQLDNVFHFISSSLIEFPHQYLIVASEKNSFQIRSANVLDKITTEESKIKLGKRIRKLIYSFPDLTEQQVLQKIVGEQEYFYERK